jgi:hypothetical protein
MAQVQSSRKNQLLEKIPCAKIVPNRIGTAADFPREMQILGL